MKNRKQKNLYGLFLMGIGSILLVIVGIPFLINIIIAGIGLYLLNYGIVLCGYPSLFMVVQRFIDELRAQFFND